MERNLVPVLLIAICIVDTHHQKISGCRMIPSDQIFYMKIIR